MIKALSVIIVLLLLLGLWWLISEPALAPIESEDINQTEDLATERQVTWYETADETFLVETDATGEQAKMQFQGEWYQLNHVPSASGARYANADESVIFWEQAGEALVEIDGEVVVQNAMASTQPPGQSSTELPGTSWEWVRTTYTEGSDITPHDPGAFILSFIDEQSFGAQTDCNNVAGKYTLDGRDIEFSELVSTKMACMDETQEAEFTAMLQQVELVMTRQSQELVIDLSDGGVMYFTFIPG